MTGGLAYEALNNVGKEHTRMIVILNDNQMSIDTNVGAISRHLKSLRTRLSVPWVEGGGQAVPR